MKITGLNFSEAVHAAKETGRRIRRASWLNKGFVIRLCKDDDRYYTICDEPHIFVQAEFDANDWEVVPNPPKPMTFQEAMEKVREGKSVRRLQWVNDFICRHNDMPHATLHVGKMHTEHYVPTFNSIAATDWVIVEGQS